ncbi:MAG TPA: SusD/RagB family nutrient-binding outer membrane lipoprotein, partial [Porphyromonadaceae bacterium]|nr:SusD/RagB family nutrient-binding outer membrane lipoprotein [Porphyromonadaceae bacterium]
MKQVIKYISIALSIIIYFSCSNFEDINTNPDASTKVNSSLLATGVISNLVKPVSMYNFTDHLFVSMYLGWGEGTKGEQYNNFGRINFDKYTLLKDCETMAELAPDDAKNAYEGLGLLIKSITLFNLTISVGDIPYSQILQGEEGVFTPKYDSQKDVCLHILEDLETAYSKLSNATDFEGDIVYGGDSKKWAKVVSAFQLRVLINLSKKATDQDLKIVERFKKVYDTGLLMESNTDNLQLTFSDKAGQLYPINSSQYQHWEYPMVSDFMIDILKRNQDYRLFYYAKPSQIKLDEGISSNSWDAFVGVDPTAPLAEIKSLFAQKACSGLNARYVSYIPGEPFITLGYAEQNFILAEAALRGWINGDPNEFYKRGIRANMEFISKYTPDDITYHYGHPLTPEYISAFIEKESVQLTGSLDDKLEKILEQKYIAAFMQLPY